MTKLSMDIQCTVKRFDEGLKSWIVDDIRAVEMATAMLLDGDMSNSIPLEWKEFTQRVNDCAKKYIGKI